MGKGQRHSKNAGTMGCESMTYAERIALGYGTVRERLGKVSSATLLWLRKNPDYLLGCFRLHKPTTLSRQLYLKGPRLQARTRWNRHQALS